MPEDGRDWQPAEENGNGANVNGSSPQAPLRRSAFRALVQDFSPIWFTWCMNSGALAQLLHDCPYTFRGLDILAGIFYSIDLLLYVLFTIIFILRFALYKRAAYDEITTNVTELTFFSCWSIAFMTLTSGAALLISTSYWGGHPFAIVSYVMWWFVMTWNLLLLMWVFVTVIRNRAMADQRIPASIIIPAVSVSTIAITGASVVTYGKALSTHLAIPIMVLSFLWVGIGIFMGFILTGTLFNSLMSQGWPAPEQTTSVFILVGPMGQSAAALQILGTAATEYGRFAQYDKGTFLTAKAAEGLNSACVLVALMLSGLGLLWTLFGIAAMIDRAVHRQLSWSISWNAIIFPVSTLTTSLAQFALEFESPAYRVITTVFILVLVIVYFVNLGFTLLRVGQGKLLIVREDSRVKQHMEEQQKER